ncbi:kinesin-like protein KIF25 isoform X2 [Amia ocellicauda]|uniref:kinesin-like protein KIF25 isoform X2 n=1 Tax=Amia ocellicauda TaxID=2972642 RepID=UPI003463CA8F
MPVFIHPEQTVARHAFLLQQKLRWYGHICRKTEERVPTGQQEQQRLHPVLVNLLTEVHVLRQNLADLYSAYVGFSSELEQQSRGFLEQVNSVCCSIQDRSVDVRNLQAQVVDLEKSLHEEKERYKNEKQRRKVLHNTLIELRGNIRVHCRVRPLLHLDAGLCDTDVLPRSTLSEKVVHAVNEDTVVVECSRSGNPPMNKVFEFERVHGPNDSQKTVFEDVRPLLTSLLDGYNVCVMAYGQTGSGKSYTMIGSQTEDTLLPEKVPHEGIIPRATRELFSLVSKTPRGSHDIELSVLEVYNNEVWDLLARDCEGAAGGVKRDVVSTNTGTSEVPSLMHERVQSAEEALRLIGHVLHLRARNSTLVHADSSRSHLVITLTVTSKGPDALDLAHRLQSTQQGWRSQRGRRGSSGRLPEAPTGIPCPSPCPRPSLTQAPLRTKLHLVDLAGSECVGMSGVTGIALRETSFINRSLSALSDVLGALSEQRPHIPYRNSKLTHFLQDCIGGEAKLLVMLCVSPTQRFLSESLQSLGFGTRARQVQKEPCRKKSGATKLK